MSFHVIECPLSLGGDAGDPRVCAGETSPSLPGLRIPPAPGCFYRREILLDLWPGEAGGPVSSESGWDV